MVNCHKLPARHACDFVGLSRDSYRHESQTSALNAKLREQIVQTAHVRRRWGYRMIHDVLRPRYPNINYKRVYRIYTTEGAVHQETQEDQTCGCAGAASGGAGRQSDFGT